MVVDQVVNQPMAGMASAKGSLGEDALLEITKNFNRIDFVLRPKKESTPFLSLFGEVAERFGTFCKAIIAWAHSQEQQVVRVAVGADDYLLTDGPRGPYEIMKDMIRVINIDADRFSDFNFQVNLKCVSEVIPSLEINRLSNWSALMVKYQYSSSVVSPSIEGGNNYYCRCLLDINTDAARVDPIERADLGGVTLELVSIALGILDSGIE